jgi:site-specific recombinase XerD
MRRLILAYSVLTWRPGYGGWEASRKSESGWGIGCFPEQAIALLEAPDPDTMKGKRDLALLAILLACGLRRHEVIELNVSDLQQREDHWAIVDLVGKACHVRTIPVPDWVKHLVDD